MMGRNSVLAKFTGTTSCGFVHGVEYRVKIFTHTYKGHNWIWVKDLQGVACCPYDTIQAIADNWEIPSSGKNVVTDHPVSNRIMEDV